MRFCLLFPPACWFVISCPQNTCLHLDCLLCARYIKDTSIGFILIMDDMYRVSPYNRQVNKEICGANSHFWRVIKLLRREKALRSLAVASRLYSLASQKYHFFGVDIVRLFFPLSPKNSCAPWLYRVSIDFKRKADYLVGYRNISLRRAKRFAGQISALISSSN